ncbi:MAG: FAD-binding oxidoreductase [Solirubrobacterales bacterium]
MLRRDAAYDRWGEAHAASALGPDAERMLGEELGSGEPLPPVPLEAVRVAAPQPIPAEVVAAAGGEDAISTDDEDRIRHAAGKGYPDLIRMRSGEVSEAPDAVLAPPDADHVAAALAACAAAGVAVVPFGGGTSVVGGVEPLRGRFGRLVSLDLTALREAIVDPVSMVARLGPGLRGPEAEAALNSAGFTLGHFPQSYRYATIGGYAATRSAGQASSGYGRFDAITTSLELTGPEGRLRTLETPHTAAGPSLRELILGSEGILGVITDVGVRIRPVPERRRYEGWFAPSFAEGIAIARSLAQEDALPDVVRLSDREETRVSLAMSGLAGIRRRGFDSYLRLRGRSDGCMLIAGWEGEREAVERRRQLSRRLLRRGGAVPLGGSPGRAWEHGRYEGPHLRDLLIDRGILVETLETSHLYGRLDELYAAVSRALRTAMAAGGAGAIVMCHLSHVYRDGASLYFTFLTRARAGGEIEQWRAIKAAACEAIVASGGTITHHHAVGRDHAPYMRSEVGELGLDALIAVKERLDPAGIMNPGKLIAA